eukprot:SAG31_NODE_5881_length_2277_cov_1.500918_3_plen_166_part_00
MAGGVAFASHFTSRGDGNRVKVELNHMQSMWAADCAPDSYIYSLGLQSEIPEAIGMVHNSTACCEQCEKLSTCASWSFVPWDQTCLLLRRKVGDTTEGRFGCTASKTKMMSQWCRWMAPMQLGAQLEPWCEMSLLPLKPCDSDFAPHYCMAGTKILCTRGSLLGN